MRNKKADTSIVILVLLVLMVSGLALFVFNVNDGKINKKISDLSVIEQVYVKADVIDFYLTKIIGKVGKDASNSAFNAELDKYKNAYGNYIVPELSQAKDKNFEIKLELEEGDLKIVYTHKFEYNEERISKA